MSRNSPLWKKSKEELMEAVEQSTSFAQVLKKLGMRYFTSTLKTLQRVLKSQEIDISKFPIGKGAWGKKFNKIRHDANYLAYIERWKEGNEKGYMNSYLFPVTNQVRRFLHEKFKNSCSECGWSKINPFTKRVPLQVHHVDGDAKNCKEENLELLCGACHSLTENFGKRNKKSSRIKRYACKA